MIDVHVHHNSYHVSNVTDLAVMNLQAERRRDKDNEVTIVHSHPYETTKQGDHYLDDPTHNYKEEVACDENCRIFEPGFVTRSIFSDVKEPIQEEA